MKIRVPNGYEKIIRKLLEERIAVVEPQDARRLAVFLRPIRENMLIGYDDKRRKSILFLDSPIKARVVPGPSKIHILFQDNRQIRRLSRL